MKGMSMERRALIAFVASMVLFLGYDALYLGPKMKAQRARREAAVLAQARQDSAYARVDTIGAPHTPPSLTTPARHDTLAPPKFSRELADEIPDAHLVTIQNGGHVVMVEAVERFNRLVLNFLDDGR